MAGIGQDDHRGRRGIEILDREVPIGGWQHVDLPRMLDRLRAEPAGHGLCSTLSATASGGVVAFPAPSVSLVGSVAPDIPRHVPKTAFVSVGRRAGSLVPQVAPGRSRSRFANDNVAGAPARSVWRDLFFLAILAATVLGAFYSGRVHGIQKVIVVPGPSSFYSVVT